LKSYGHLYNTTTEKRGKEKKKKVPRNGTSVAKVRGQPNIVPENLLESLHVYILH